MIALLALALVTTDPAQLLGGPEDVQPEPRSGAVIYAYEDETYRAEGSSERYRYERTTTGWTSDRGSARPIPSLQAGDPVHLEDDFFRGPLVGGVGSEPPRVIVVRQSGHHHYRWR